MSLSILTLWAALAAGMAWIMTLLNRTVAGLLCFGALAVNANDVEGPAPLAWRWAQYSAVIPAGEPVVSGNVVYVASGGRVYALDRRDGNQIWRYPTAEPLTGNFRQAPVKAGELIVAVGDDRQIHALDSKTGKLVWHYVSPMATFGGPAADENTVVVPLSGNLLLALDAKTGTALWPEPYFFRDNMSSNIAMAQGAAILLGPSKMVALNVATQKPLWSVNFSTLSSTAKPVVYGDTIYINSGTWVIAARAATGSARWQRNTGDALVFAPAVSAEGVAALSQSGRLYTFDLNGRVVFQRGAALDSAAIAAPTFAGKLLAVPTTDGALNLINPKTGDLVWSYVVPPLVKGTTVAATGRQTQNARPTEIKYVQAVGAPIVSGSTLMLLVRDGSLLGFDRDLGVDITPPSVEMLWPNPGEQISGQPPLELLFHVEDVSTGVNTESLSIDIDGRPLEFQTNAEGAMFVKVSATGANKPFDNGRRTFTVRASDWMGNTVSKSFALTIDNTLRPIGGPPTKVGTPTRQGGQGGQGGRGRAGMGG